MIIRNPSDKKVPYRNSLTFSVEAFGDGLTYQWQKDNMNLQSPNDNKFKGILTMMLTVNDVQSEDAGTYSCEVTDETQKSVTSNEAILIVGRYLNLCTLL